MTLPAIPPFESKSQLLSPPRPPFLFEAKSQLASPRPEKEERRGAAEYRRKPDKKKNNLHDPGDDVRVAREWLNNLGIT